ncbi:MAG: hypothetical protein ACOYD7_03855 [Raoultibacter sp.]|jgi:hypothetical protein
MKKSKDDASVNENTEQCSFDFEGLKIGDDGFPMTRTRTQMHHLFNAYLFWGVIAILACIGFAVWSYFQGQEMTFFELTAYGGILYNDFSLATLMRAEAAFCLLVGICSIAMSLYGFAWFYDNASSKPVKRISLILTIACVIWFCLYLIVGIVEPVAPIVAVFLLLQRRMSKKVLEEKPCLEQHCIPSKKAEA